MEENTYQDEVLEIPESPNRRRVLWIFVPLVGTFIAAAFSFFASDFFEVIESLSRGLLDDDDMYIYQFPMLVAVVTSVWAYRKTHSFWVFPLAVLGGILGNMFLFFILFS